MSIVRMTEGNLKKIAPLFDGWSETLIATCLEGTMGSGWAESSSKPQSAQIVIADFALFAGLPNEELVRNRPAEYDSDSVIMLPQNEGWAKLMEEVYQEKATPVRRYAIKKERDIFDVQKLSAIVQNRGADYEIRRMDKEICHMAMSQEWSRDFCAQFEDPEDFCKKGLGVVLLHQGELVAGASSYTVYQGGIEIEIDTREDHRRRGLALICGAQLILECLQRNLYPSWDAQNIWSLGLAKKLGYHFDREYLAYEVSVW